MPITFSALVVQEARKLIDMEDVLEAMIVSSDVYLSSSLINFSFSINNQNSHTLGRQYSSIIRSCQQLNGFKPIEFIVQGIIDIGELRVMPPKGKERRELI